MITERERLILKATIRRRLEQCINSEGHYVIEAEDASSLLEDFENVCDSYEDEIENMGYEMKEMGEHD